MRVHGTAKVVIGNYILTVISIEEPAEIKIKGQKCENLLKLHYLCNDVSITVTVMRSCVAYFFLNRNLNQNHAYIVSLLAVPVNELPQWLMFCIIDLA